MNDFKTVDNRPLLYFKQITNQQSSRFLFLFSFLGSDCQIIRSDDEFINLLQEIFQADHLVYLPLFQQNRLEDLLYLLNHSIQMISVKDGNFLFDQGNKKGQIILNFIDPTLAQSHVTALIMNHYLQKVRTLESSIHRIENHVEILEQVLYQCQTLLSPGPTNIIVPISDALPDMNHQQMHQLASTSSSTVEYGYDQPTIYIQKEEQMDIDEARTKLKASIPNLSHFYPACDELLSKLLLLREHQHTMSKLDDLKEFVKSQIHLLLKCSVVEASDALVGIPLTGTALSSPTSPQTSSIQFHVLVRDDMEPDWKMMLYSHFKELEMLSLSHTSLEQNDETGKQVTIRDLMLFQSSPNNTYVRFLINDIPVKIFNDPSNATSMYAFIEEISDFIGKDHLLKRSYLLIRSFFIDEIFPSLQFTSPSSTSFSAPMTSNTAITPTTATTTTTNKLTSHSATFTNLLSHSSSFYSPRPSYTAAPANTATTNNTTNTPLPRSSSSMTYDTDDWWIMTLAIFNRYLPLIEHPLQALVLFCFEYSTYYEAIDTKKYAHFISLFGVIDVNMMTSLPTHATSSSSSSSASLFLSSPSFLSSSTASNFLLESGSKDFMKLPIRFDQNYYHFPLSLLLKYSIIIRKESSSSSSSSYLNQSYHPQSHHQPLPSYEKKHLFHSSSLSPSTGDFILPLRYPMNLLSSKSLSNNANFLIFHPIRGSITINKTFSMKVFHYATIELLLKLNQLQNPITSTNATTPSFSSSMSLYSKDILSLAQFSRILFPMVHHRISSSSSSSSFSLFPLEQSISALSTDGKASRLLSQPAQDSLLDLRYSIPKDRLLYFTHYCNLINKIIVTEPALLVAAIESLEMKGALPVGEVGKAMAQHSNIVVVSKYIKDKYTGLKKFLERFPLIFVVSNDHSYNPHVYLRSKLSSQHLALVSEENILPIEIMIQYRAGKPSRTVLKQLAQIREKGRSSTDR